MSSGHKILLFSGLRFLMAEVKIIDVLILVGSIFAIFPYGASFLGFSGGQVVALRLAVSLLCLVLLAFRHNGLFQTSYSKLVLAYAMLLILVGVIAPVSPGSAVLQGVLVLLIFAALHDYASRYGLNMLVRSLYVIILAATVMMDAYAFATGGSGSLTWDNEYIASSYYILGDKFLLSYLNMLCIALGAIRYKTRFPMVVLSGLGLASCLLVGCSTGVVGIIVIFSTCMLGDRVKRIVTSPWLVPFMLISMAVITVGVPRVLQLPAIQNFIVDVLGESGDFTGRLTIYPHLVDLWMQKPLLGYGSNGAANSAVMLACGAPNAQEGLFHILLSNGAIGGLLFLSLCYKGFAGGQSRKNGVVGLYAFVISMSLCSIVEINLGPLFLLAIFLIRIANSSNDVLMGALDYES